MNARTTTARSRKKTAEQQQPSGGTKGIQAKRAHKKTEYGKQLDEKQKVKRMYGLRERQFRNLFDEAVRSKEATGETLLNLLERRLDNVVYRLKFANSRAQSRQIVVHGHILVNGKKAYSPSYLVKVTDKIMVAPAITSKPIFLESVVEKRLKSLAKVPEWLELDRKNMVGRVLRLPVRADLQVPIEERLIIELYSK